VNGDNLKHAYSPTQLNTNPHVAARADARNPAANTTDNPTGEIGKPWQQFFSTYTCIRIKQRKRVAIGT
jgi:hypothetical protein